MSDGVPDTLGPNLVTNGDFSHGTALWSVRRWDNPFGSEATAPAPFDVVEGALCTTIQDVRARLGASDLCLDDMRLTRETRGLQ